MSASAECSSESSTSGEDELGAPGSQSYGDEWSSIITREWLEDVARDELGNGTRVTSYNLQPACDAADSVLSDIVAATVECAGIDGSSEKTLHLVVKLLPRDPFSRFFVTEAQFDLREIKFYTQIVPELEAFEKEKLSDVGEAKVTYYGLPVPRCIQAHYAPDSDGGGSTLVLEDVRAKGYSVAPFTKGLTSAQAAAALSAVAKVHAASLCYKIRSLSGAPLNDRYAFLFQTAKASDSYQQLVERGMPQLAAFLRRQPDNGGPGVLSALEQLRADTRRIIGSLLAPEEPYALITHTDFWCNNLMFRNEEEHNQDPDNNTSCIILDWQMATYGRPTNDVALLLVSSVDAEIRRRHTETLLNSYWKALTMSCKRLGLDIERELGYDYRRLKTDYRRSQLLALLLCIGSVDVAIGDAATENRLLTVLADLHADGVLDPTLAD